MNALVSGQAAVAVLLEGDRITSFTWDSSDIEVPCRRDDLRFLEPGSE